MSDNATLDRKAMLRDVFIPQLQEELQQTGTEYMDLATDISSRIPETNLGKRIEFDGIGKTEVDFRKQEYETVDPKVFKHYKRAMLPVGLVHSLKKTEDHEIRSGAFQVTAADFIKQMRNGWNRKLSQCIIGSVWDATHKMWQIPTDKVGDAGSEALPLWTFSEYQSGDDGDFYSVDGDAAPGALGGLLGTNYVGANLTTKEVMVPYAMLTTGSLDDPQSYAYDGSNLDIEKTNVLPVNFVRSGTPARSGMTEAKLLGIREAFETRYAVKDGDIINLGITPKQKYDLIALDKFQQGKYGFQTLKNGLMSEVLGIRFYVTSLIPQVNIGKDKTTNLDMVYANPAWITSDLMYAMWKNVDMKYVEPSTAVDWGLWKAWGSIGSARARKETTMMVLCA